MKHIKFITSAIVFFLLSFLNAQTSKNEMYLGELPVIHLSHDVSLHFISPEPIQFVDLSTNHLTGDLPSEQIARIKITDTATEQKRIVVTDTIATYSMTNKVPKKFFNGEYLGIVTIVGQSFMVQYKLVFQNQAKAHVISNIQIQAEDMQPLEQAEMKLSALELKRFCQQIEQIAPKKPLRKTKKLKLKMTLNNVYVVEDYIFVDLSLTNKTHLSYDIEDIKFSIEDKKIYKATNNQSIPLKPIFQYHYQKRFKRHYRNIFVFKKFTFPNSKTLKIRWIENQISGRTIEMKVKYSDVLNADTL